MTSSQAEPRSGKFQGLAGREVPVANILPWISTHRIAVLIALGILFRVAQYLANRSYWLDESALAGNIRFKTFLELFGPLYQTQLAPPGFLAIEWVLSRTLGDGPFVLRLVPLAGGIASLFLFHRLAQRVLRPGAVVIAVALFAFSDDLIYFSSELKQYSTDVAIVMACTLMGLSIASRPLTLGRLTRLALAGSVAIWFSHPAAFVLAGVGTVVFVQVLRSSADGPPPATYDRATQIRHLMIVGFFWTTTIVALREVSLRQLHGLPDMWHFWDFAFPPWPPKTLADLVWPLRRGAYLFLNPLDYYWPLRPGLMAFVPWLLFLAGCVSLAKREKTAFALIAAPAGFALFAAYSRLFPFHGRLVLFLVPTLLLAIAEGADWACPAPELNAKASGKGLAIAEGADWASQKVGRRWLRLIFVAILLLFPTLGDVYHLAVPRIRAGLNPYGDRRDWKLNPDRFPF